MGSLTFPKIFPGIFPTGEINYEGNLFKQEEDMSLGFSDKWITQENRWIDFSSLYMPNGELSSIPGNYDRDAIMVDIKRDTFGIYMTQVKLYAAGNKYDKFFKNSKDLVNWLNKNKAKYVGIDRR